MKKFSITSLVLMGLVSAGCAQKAVEKNLDTKVNAEPTISGPADLTNEASTLIDQSKLNDKQKTELKDLQRNTSTKMAQLRDESLKLRAVLIQDVFSPKYNKTEVLLIQNKIEKIEHKRVALIFETIDKANGIFGRETDAEENQRLMDRAIFNRVSQ